MTISRHYSHSHIQYRHIRGPCNCRGKCCNGYRRCISRPNRKWGVIMGVLYAKKIVAGEINYSDVKKLWQAKTLKALQDMVASGEITEEQYNELISK